MLTSRFSGLVVCPNSVLLYKIVILVKSVRCDENIRLDSPLETISNIIKTVVITRFSEIGYLIKLCPRDKCSFGSK